MIRAFLVLFLCFALNACKIQSQFGAGIDTIPGRPQITLSTNVSSPTNNNSISVTLSANKSIQGLTNNDFTCTNCIVASIVGSGLSYTISITPAEGAVSLVLPANSVSDLFGNLNTVSNVLNWTYDATTPNVVSNVSPFNGAQLSSTTVEVSGGCESGATVRITGNINNQPVQGPCSSGQFNIEISLTAANVNRNIEIIQTDLAGNVSTAAAFTYHALSVYPSSLYKGFNHTCASMSDDSLRCWGLNENGQLGDNTLVSKNIPTEVRLDDVDGAIINLSVGSLHTCAIDEEEKLYCWGADADGQLGNGDAGSANLTAPAVVVTVEVPELLELGEAHSCFVNDSARVFCTGKNDLGQAGTDPNSKLQLDDFTPVGGALDEADTSVQAIAAGAKHTCAIRKDNTDSSTAAYCWGANNHGQLGNDSTVSSHEAVEVLEFVDDGPNVALEDISSIIAGDLHSCALKSDDTVWCWGDNTSQQLGNSTIAVNSPVAVRVTGLTGVSAIYGGANHTCALLESTNTLRCWGLNANGQLGNHTIVSSNTPVDFKNLNNTAPLRRISNVSMGENHTCVHLEYGSIICVGENSNGQLGNNNNTNSHIPVITNFITPAP